jgi:hypothetical protein
MDTSRGSRASGSPRLASALGPCYSEPPEALAEACRTSGLTLLIVPDPTPASPRQRRGWLHALAASLVAKQPADRCRIHLGATTWRSVAVDLGPISHVGGRRRPGPLGALCDLSVTEGRVAAAAAAGGEPLEPSPSGRRRASAGWRDAMSLPLEGLLVADFSYVLPGPLAAMMLADLGAIVIKVERPGVGDDTRQWGSPWTDNSSSYFEAASRSKKSVELDLFDPKDLQLARELARRPAGELPRRQPGAQRSGLRRGCGREPSHRVRLDHRVRQPRGTRPARVRLRRPGGRRPDEHHWNAGGADEGRRRARRCTHCKGCGHRHPRGAASPRVRRNGATGRGQLAVQPPWVRWPTRPRPTWRRQTHRRAWATGTRPSLPTKLGRQRRASRRLLWQ